MPLDRIDGEILFDIDYNSLEQALVGTGWLSDWVVTGNASTLSVDVALGSGLAAGVLKSTGSSTNIVLTAADATNPRKDIIIWDTSLPGLTKVTGTAQAIAPAGESNPRKMKLPAPPDLTATDDILIAVVYVPAGATLGSSCTIINKRVKTLLTATAPTTQAFGDSPTIGTSLEATRGDHKHGMPTMAYFEIAPPTPTSPTPLDAWVNWDLSAFIPAGALYAEVIVFAAVDNATAYFSGIRKDDSAIARGFSVPSKFMPYNATVKLNANRIVERYSASLAGFPTTPMHSFSVVGYWK